MHSSSCFLWSSCFYHETIPLKELLIQLRAHCRALFGACNLILRQYLFKELLIQSACLSSCSLWSLHFYLRLPLKELLIQFARSSSCYLWSSHSYSKTIPFKELLIQSARLSFMLIFFFEFPSGCYLFCPPKFEGYSGVFELLRLQKDNFHFL